MNKDQYRELEKIINDEYQNTTGIVIYKNHQLVYEKYFHDCTRDSQIHVYSVTKSIMSILIGIAIDKGYIASVNQKVLEFFPDYQPYHKNKIIHHITLKHLLTMTTPYQYHFFPPYRKYFQSQDWILFTLDLLGGRKQIGQFTYAPLIGPDLLSLGEKGKYSLWLFMVDW